MLFIAALGIKCYTCTSMESAEDCVEQQQLVTCPPGTGRCQTLYTTFNNGSTMTKQFVKQCVSGESCNVPFVCKDPDWTCLHGCCDQNACNESEYQEHRVKCEIQNDEISTYPAPPPPKKKSCKFMLGNCEHQLA